MRISDYLEDTTGTIDEKKLVKLNCDRLKKLMRKENVDALFVNSQDNWRYVTALPFLHSVFSATANAALVYMDDPSPFIFPMEGFGNLMQQSADWIDQFEELPMCKTREGMQPMEVDKWPQIIANKLSQLGLADATIAIDPSTSFALKESLQLKLNKAQFVDAGLILRQARSVKNEEELKALRSACALADIAMEDAFKATRADASELDVAAAVEHSFRKNGAEYCAFTPQVFSGVHSLMPYLNPSSKKLSNGELVRIDIGCCSHGYNSCFGRTASVGRPDELLEEAYVAVHQSIIAGIEGARPGVTNIELHQIMADAMFEHSGGKYSLGGYGGHGLGAGIHEDPMIGDKNSVDEIVLEANMCVALEPSVMVPERGWLGLEDNIIITSSGCEVLTKTGYGLNLNA